MEYIHSKITINYKKIVTIFTYKLPPQKKNAYWYLSQKTGRIAILNGNANSNKKYANK